MVLSPLLLGGWGEMDMKCATVSSVSHDDVLDYSHWHHYHLHQYPLL